MVLTASRTQSRFLVLPPSRLTSVPGLFRKVQVDNGQYDDRFAEMQRFRGQVYHSDGAVQASDLVDGRHKVPIDEQSWHVLSLDASGRICACLRYLEERKAGGFNDLWVRHAELARSPVYGERFRQAVEEQMAQSRKLHLGFGEVGGWAVAESHRRTLEPLRIILATYALLQLHGGCTGVATATFRHSSANILRRIGLSPIQSEGAALPPYYDPKYGCHMELLTFDSRHPNDKYRDSVRELTNVLAESPVLCRNNNQLSIHRVMRPAAEAFVPTQELPIAV